MKRWIVTAATVDFMPGVQALFNSARSNAPDVSLALFYYGGPPIDVGADKVFVNYLGSIPSVRDEGWVYHKESGRTVGVEMYARMFIPECLDGRAFWADADCCILNDISELWDMPLNGHPMASVDRGDIGYPTLGYAKPAMGTALYDCSEWNRRELTQKGWDIMTEGTDAPGKIGNVEGLSAMLLKGDFLHLNRTYNVLTPRSRLSLSDKVAHFVGDKPWDDGVSCNYRDLWKAYHDNDIKRANEIMLEWAR